MMQENTPEEEDNPEANELEEMRMYTVTQVAKVFNVTAYTVRVWLNTDNGLRGTKVGSGNRGTWRISKQEMVRFANDRFGSDLTDE